MRISDWSSDVCSSDLNAAERIDHAERIANSDALTGLANGRTLQRVLELELARAARQIGRASCRDRECQFVLISVVAVSLKTKRPRHISDDSKFDLTIA